MKFRKVDKAKYFRSTDFYEFTKSSILREFCFVLFCFGGFFFLTTFCVRRYEKFNIESLQAEIRTKYILIKL